MKKSGLLLCLVAIAGCDTESFVCPREYNDQLDWELFIDYENKKLRVGPEEDDNWVEADFDGPNPNKITWKVRWRDRGTTKIGPFSFDKRTHFLTYGNKGQGCVSR